MPRLSAATAVRLGATAVDALYLGSVHVWPPASTVHGALAGTTSPATGALTAASPLFGSLAGTLSLPVAALTGTAAASGAETFTGSNGAAWPSPWTGASGTADIQSNAGRLLTTTGLWSQAFIRRTAPADAEILFKWQWQGSGATVDIAIRCAGTAYGDNPKWTFRMLPDAIWLSGSSGLLDTASTTHTVSTWYWARVRWQGATVQGRTWADGGSEPGSWAVEATDGGSPASGYLIFRTETFTSGAGTALFDDLTLTDLSGSTGSTSGALATTVPMPTGALTGGSTGADPYPSTYTTTY